MKTSRLLLSVAVFATAALAATAAFESARVLPDNPMPVYPPALRMEGITQGRAIVAISIDRDGRVKDQLVLATPTRALRAPARRRCATGALSPPGSMASRCRCSSS